MSWKCFFGHEWEEENRKAFHVYADEDDSIPLAYYTRILFKCKKCKKLKVQKLDGDWQKRTDDDDDDNEPPKQPMMSPDDFYERIEKE